MLLILFLIFTIIPLGEIFLLIKVGDIIGTWDTIGLIVASGIIGAYAAKTQGRNVLSQIEAQLRSGQQPSTVFLEALLIFIGGLLMIAPGFITDFMGMAFILPYTRTLCVKGFRALFNRGVNLGKIHVYTDNPFSKGPFGGTEPRKKPSPLNKDAEVIDISSYRNKE